MRWILLLASLLGLCNTFRVVPLQMQGDAMGIVSRSSVSADARCRGEAGTRARSTSSVLAGGGGRRASSGEWPCILRRGKSLGAGATAPDHIRLRVASPSSALSLVCMASARQGSSSGSDSQGGGGVNAGVARDGDTGGSNEMGGVDTAPGRRRLPLLKDVKTLEQMFQVIGEDAGPLSSREAAVAMNHLSRLSRGWIKKKERTMVADHMARLSALAADGMPSFESKHVAWSLNAAKQMAGNDEALKLFFASLERLEEMPAQGYGAQNLALTLNALSSFAGSCHTFRDALEGGRVEDKLLSMVLDQPAEVFTSWHTVSSIMNAAVNMGWSQESVASLCVHMRRVITEVLEVDEASPQSIAVIANGCANANFLDVGVMNKLSSALKHQESIAISSSSSSTSNIGGVRTSEGGLSAQGVALLVNSLYRLKHRDEAFLSLICSSALRLPASAFRPHPLALTLNGLSGLGWYDHGLMERLHESTMLLTPETPGLAGQQLANIINAYTRMDCYDERICERVASLIESMLRSGKGRTFKDVELSSICNSFSRITIASFAAQGHNEGMCNRILVMTEGLMMRIADTACELGDIGLRPAASMLNAFAKLGLRHESSLRVVASKVRSSGEEMLLADAVQMYHAAASLNFLDEGMQAVLSRVIGGASPRDFSLQSLGNAAWAAAALDEEDEVLHEALEKAIAVRFEELMLGKEVTCNSKGGGGNRQGQDGSAAVGMGGDVEGVDRGAVVVAAVKKPRATYQDLQELRQVHQYMLTRKLAAKPPTGHDQNGQEMEEQVAIQPAAGSSFGSKQEEVCRRVFEARSRNRAAPSQLQDRVVAAFRELGCGVEAEHIDKMSGYSIDIIVTVPGEWRLGGGSDLRCAVEVDGPTHFSGPDHRMGQILGKTSLKRRHLELMGWPLITIPFFEWNDLKNRESRCLYVSEKMSQALGEGILVNYAPL